MAKKTKAQTYIIGGLFYTLLFAGSGTEAIGGKDSDDKCGGEERWPIKVMIDKDANDVNEDPHDTTIADLVKINTTIKDNKYAEGKPRMPIEKQVYTIKHCFVTKVMRENDNDFHLVIEDGKGNTMIAEIPDASCTDAKQSGWISDFSNARITMAKYANSYRHYLFTVTGVLFVDKAHGQTGRAPNSVEIHPILDLKMEKKINPLLK